MVSSKLIWAVGYLFSYDAAKEKKRLVHVQKLHKKSIRKMAFAYNEAQHIFTASKDKSIKLTDLTQQTNLLTLEKAHE